MNTCCIELLDSLIACGNTQFLRDLARKLGENACHLSPASKKRMIDHAFSEHWPTSQDEEMDTTYWRAYRACNEACKE